MIKDIKSPIRIVGVSCLQDIGDIIRGDPPKYPLICPRYHLCYYILLASFGKRGEGRGWKRTLIWREKEGCSGEELLNAQNDLSLRCEVESAHASGSFEIYLLIIKSFYNTLHLTLAPSRLFLSSLHHFPYSPPFCKRYGSWIPFVVI